MAQAAKAARHNRTSTVDFHDETTYFALLDNPQAFVEFVLAFILSLGFQLLHKTSCSEGGSLTRHSHYARIRLGGLAHIPSYLVVNHWTSAVESSSPP